MKYKISIASIAVILMVYIACSKSDLLRVHLISNEQTLTKLTPATHRFGIHKLVQTAYGTSRVTYRFEGGNFTYRQVSKDEIELTLNRSGNTVLIAADKKTMMYKGQDLMADYQARAVEPLSLEEQTDIALTLTLYNELTAEGERIEGGEELRLVCKYTAISIRPNKSSSEDHLNKFVNKYLSTHPKCKRLHGVDSGCLWGDYGCVSSQEITCKC